MWVLNDWYVMDKFKYPEVKSLEIIKELWMR